MKRFALLLLAFTMLFVMASAEESFVEEDFAAAASFDDEIFAEETFFGDEFEAEQPEIEDEVEDRSVFLFEEEVRPEASKLAGWQKWKITMAQPSVKKNKVSLSWTVTMGDDPSGQPSDQPTKKQLKAQKGVKIFVYQVDPITGVAMQVKKPLAITKTKMTVTVKNPGTYTYYARLEKVVKKTANEDLGQVSNSVKAPVTDVKNAEKISKVKAYARVEPSVQPTSDQPAFVNIDVFTKKAEKNEKYTITATQKISKRIKNTYVGHYIPTNEQIEEVQGKGYISINLAEDVKDWTKDNQSAQPSFIAGKKITVKVVNDDTPKGKSGSVTPKKVTKKTVPVIVGAQQLDAKTILVRWKDDAAVAGETKPADYTISAGKKVGEAKNVAVTTLPYDKETRTYSYKLEVKPNTKSKAKNIRITVKSNAGKKSKAYKLALKPAGMCAIMDLRIDEENGGVKITWTSQKEANVAVFEAYATDRKHTAEAYVEGKAEPSAQEGTFSAVFTAEQLNALNRKYLSITIKAVNGTKVIDRVVIDLGEVPSEQPSEEPSVQ